jgi:hypothetical protein
VARRAKRLVNVQEAEYLTQGLLASLFHLLCAHDENLRLRKVLQVSLELHVVARALDILISFEFSQHLV